MTARRAWLCLSARTVVGVCGATGACALVAVSALTGACYSAGSGSGPPTNGLYYPVGLAVAQATVGSKVVDELYVVNSDFDLQYNGGTLQSYNLMHIRQDAAVLIAQNLGLGGGGGGIPFVYSYGDPQPPLCLGATNDPASVRTNGQRTPLGQGCAPPVQSTDSRYFQSYAVVGAFATDLQLSPNGKRLYMPVRGNATLTLADVDGTTAGELACGQDSDSRCSGDYLRGNVVDPGDTRSITMPGEPFGMAQTQDGTAIAITQQATQETSLLTAGHPGSTGNSSDYPSMQFVLEGVPAGGNGIVAVPHDPDAVRRCEDVGDVFPCVRQAFLETFRGAGEVDLLRYYDDDGSGLMNQARTASLHRPFLEREAAYPVSVNLPGVDQRGIVIDDTPRLKCKAQAALAAPKGSLPTADQLAACGQIPARVFIGSRSPASVIYGTIGGPSPSGDGTYDPDVLYLKGSVPADQGVSRVYLAPVVDKTGHYALRLFVVCYDASTVDVFEPDEIAALGAQAEPETVISTGTGPFAMAFDPSCAGLVDSTGATSPALALTATRSLDCGRYGPLAEVAVSEAAGLAGDATEYMVPADLATPDSPVSAAPGLRNYRFGYLATFTNSYIQVLDLDDSLVPVPSSKPGPTVPPSQETYESVVFTLGNPTPPKGS